jgi:hypothetical protein
MNNETGHPFPYLSPSPEGVHIEYFYDEYLPDVFNFMNSVLESNEQTIDLHGRCVNKARGTEYQNVKGFCSSMALENYRNAFNNTSNEEEYIFTGYVMYSTNQFKTIRRSQHGKGTDFRFEIKEYVGQDCYIPTQGNCFMKCYLYQEVKKTSSMNVAEVIRLYNLPFYDSKNNAVVGVGNNHGNIDDMILCPYLNPITKNLQFALVSKSDALCGFKELQSIIKKPSYKGQEYVGVNCYIPIKNKTTRESLQDSVNRLLTQRYKTFLFKNSGDIRGGIMTLAKIKPFNEFMGTNIVYYNTNDQHTYPKGTTNNYPMVLYLHKNHFCLINKKNKAKGIKEIEENYDKLIVYTSCDESNVKKVGNFQVNTELSNAKVFVWDLETFVDMDGDRWCKPYAAGIFPLEAVEKIAGDSLYSSEPVDDETLEKLNEEAKTFCGLECITDMLKHLGGISGLDNATLIAHNGKGFDDWLLLLEKNVIPFQVLKTGQGLASVKITNPYTSEENQMLFKKNFMERKKMKKDPEGGKFLQTLTFRCSLNFIKCSLSKMCDSFQIPSNLHKTQLDHDDITKDNFMNKISEWRPYLQLDVISLACVITKFNKIMTDLVGQNMQSCISSPQLTLKGWMSHIKGKEQDETVVHTHTDKYARHFIRKTVKGGRVFATIKNFESPLWKRILGNLTKVLWRIRDVNT